MNPKYREIIENRMIISEIEKKWNVPTSRAVELFCKATGKRKPNTDKLDSWSKNIMSKILKVSPDDGCGGCTDNKKDSCSDGGCSGGCCGCH